MDNNTTDEVQSAQTEQEKGIPELNGMKFVVPEYQRGYRWTETEVNALLDDLWEIKGKTERYCLQPLIVKRLDDVSYELIDGQQRLTTLYILMKYVEELVGSARKPTFSIEYKTRSDSKDFLEKLNENPIGENNKNIDYYFMSRAYKAMHKWVDDKRKDDPTPKDDLSYILDFHGVLQEPVGDKRKVFFLWYELGEKEDVNDVFSKVNIGKINLTNAERIKALLLNSENFKSKTQTGKTKSQEEIDREQAEIVKKQTEIAMSWDRIEQDLHNDQLWFFLNDPDSPWTNKTRIDMIFQLLAEKYNNEYNEKNPDKTKISDKEVFFSYLVLNRKLKEADDKAEAVKEIWDDVELKADHIKSWYEDFKLYHLIGYILAGKGRKETLTQMVSKIQEDIDSKGKKETLNMLCGKIEEEFCHFFDDPKAKTNNPPKIDDSLNAVKDMSYDNTTDHTNIPRVLLLFNIATLLCETAGHMRFPFDVFKQKKWEIEHIHASADDTDTADNNIGNLALLEKRDNIGLGNKPFTEKRMKIIEWDKEGDFIPLCTKNVFLKYYSNTKFQKWKRNDKDAYIKAMKATLTKFFKTKEWINNPLPKPINDKKKGEK